MKLIKNFLIISALVLISSKFSFADEKDATYGSTVQEVIESIGKYTREKHSLLSLLPASERDPNEKVKRGEEYAFPFCIHEAQKSLRSMFFPAEEPLPIKLYLGESTLIERFYNSAEVNLGSCFGKSSNFLNQDSFKNLMGVMQNETPEILNRLDNNRLIKHLRITPKTQVMINQNHARSIFKECHQKMKNLHAESLQLSTAVYDLHVPEGYTLIETFNDEGLLGTGFKAYTLRKNDDPNSIKVVFAGTEGLSDWISNASLGKSQFKKFKDKVLKGLEDEVAKGKNVHFSGHSLGGGLAQYFSYQLMENFSNKYPNKEIDSLGMGQIHTTTWNAFGAEDMAEKIFGNPLDLSFHGTTFDHGSVHYTTKGDAVSDISGEHTFGHRRELNIDHIINAEIGHHYQAPEIGQTGYLAKGYNYLSNKFNKTRATFKAHKLTTIARAINSDRQILAKSSPVWVDNMERPVYLPPDIGEATPDFQYTTF